MEAPLSSSRGLQEEELVLSFDPSSLIITALAPRTHAPSPPLPRSPHKQNSTAEAVAVEVDFRMPGHGGKRLPFCPMFLLLPHRDKRSSGDSREGTETGWDWKEKANKGWASSSIGILEIPSLSSGFDHKSSGCSSSSATVEKQYDVARNKDGSLSRFLPLVDLTGLLHGNITERLAPNRLFVYPLPPDAGGGRGAGQQGR